MNLKKNFWVKNFLPFLFSSFAQSCTTLCNPKNRSTPGLPVHHWLLESTQTHVHWVDDAQMMHQSLFKWVSSSHQVAKVLEFQLQHQSFQWIPRIPRIYYLSFDLCFDSDFCQANSLLLQILFLSAINSYISRFVLYFRKSFHIITK